MADVITLKHKMRTYKERYRRTTDAELKELYGKLVTECMQDLKKHYAS